MMSMLAAAIAQIDLGILRDLGIYGVGFVALTHGGNIACRTILNLSGVALAPPTAVPANPEVVTPASAPLASTAGAPAGAAANAPPAAPASTTPATTARAGRMIGSLERLVILFGLAAGSWEIIAAVIALKSIGRFKELDEQLQAEYFLIGSLASLVWAAAISLALLWFDHSCGFDLASLIQAGKGG